MTARLRRLRLGDRWPFAFVIAAPLVLFAPFLAGAQVLYWGTPLLQFYPWRWFAVETIRAGHLPLWNPHLGNGAPLMANHQSAIFYPPNWLSLVMPLDLSMSWLVALHLIAAGAGMVTLARALGLRPLGQVVAGLAFGLSQYLVSRAWFFSINAAVAWVPWVIWAGDRLIHSHLTARPGQAAARHGVSALALVLALQLLAGHAQTTWYTWLLLAAWLAWRLITAGRPPRRLYLSLLGRLALAFALALGVAAIQLLPTAELLRESPRADSAGYEFVMTYSFSPWRLLTLAAPDLLGNPARGRFYGYGNYWEDAIYAGVLPLLLAVGAISGTAFRRDANLQNTPAPNASLPLFLALHLPPALLLALGRNTPVFPFLYQHVPTFDMFQAPARMLIWFVFALALLAGLGADGWRPPAGRALYWTRLGAAGAAAMALVGTAALIGLAPANAIAVQIRTVAAAVAAAGLLLFVTALLSLIRPAHDAGRWSAAVAAFLTLDLLVANYGLNPGGPPDLYRAPTASGPALARALEGRRLLTFPDDEYQLRFHYFSFLTFGPPEYGRALRESLSANAALVEGVASLNNFDPLVSARYAGLTEVISATRSTRLLNLANVGAVASPEALPWEPLAESERVSFYRPPGDARRAWLVHSAQAVPDAAAARAAIARPDFDPAATVILETAEQTAAAPAEAPGTVRILTAHPNAVTIAVASGRAGWLVLADTYYPGWVAEVDGRPTPILAADLAFRAVAVEAGEHMVEFRYEPASFRWGALISGLSLAGWLGGLAGRRRLRRRPAAG